MSDLKRRDITPIVDLSFRRAGLDRQFPEPGFPAFVCDLRWPPSRSGIHGCSLYAGQRDVHLRRPSAKYGWWNEQLKTDRSFVTALKTIVRANVLAMEILKRRPDAIFIQSESSEFPRRQPGGNRPGGALNARRFLPSTSITVGASTAACTNI